jgi:hypothetical protein
LTGFLLQSHEHLVALKKLSFLIVYIYDYLTSVWDNRKGKRAISNFVAMEAVGWVS